MKSKAILAALIGLVIPGLALGEPNISLTLIAQRCTGGKTNNVVGSNVAVFDVTQSAAPLRNIAIMNRPFAGDDIRAAKAYFDALERLDEQIHSAPALARIINMPGWRQTLSVRDTDVVILGHLWEEGEISPYMVEKHVRLLSGRPNTVILDFSDGEKCKRPR